jgi:MoaA/NifB/PqqE/SkfB family radical SAM enzyme
METLDTEELRAFLRDKVISTINFQVGCVMEPTLDPRLGDLMILIANSPAKPQENFMLQTNGTLLHRHDHEKFRSAGLTELSVSVDSVEPETQKSLRSGMSLEKVLRNVEGFRRACPTIKVTFIATVTKANISKMPAMVASAINSGIESFVFREVFYHRDNDIVDHTRMPDLVLEERDFELMAQVLQSEFGSRASLTFADRRYLDASSEKMVTDSRYRG